MAKGKDSGLRYFGIESQYRANVREPLLPPVLKVLTPAGMVRYIPMSEAELLELAEDAIKALNRMRKSRGATVHDG